ncbi:MAG: PH domain-containing protein [Caldilineae bacterium]|nr:MAG: PH domain-containing protein [Caldilineae bacterium]
MSIKKLHAAVTAHVWKAIAQGEVDTTGIPREALEALVEVAVDAALDEVNRQLEQFNPPPASAKVETPTGDDEEVVLWEGRPFLSLTRYYIITNERIRLIQGLIGKEYEDIELVRVQDVDFQQTLAERALNLGDIHIRSHDPSDPHVTLDNVQNPQQVHEILRRAVIKARKKYRLSYREEM